MSVDRGERGVRDRTVWRRVGAAAAAGCVLFAVGWWASPGGASARPVRAVTREAPTPANPAVQRNEMIRVLRSIDAKLGRVEALLSEGLAEGVPVRAAPREDRRAGGR